MRRVSIAASIKANEVAAENCTELSIVAESCKWFPGLAKRLYSPKPASSIHYISGEPERSCYAWVEGKYDPPARALIKMLRSDEGWRIYEYLMRGCKQQWWVETQRARRCGLAYEIERVQFELEL